MQEKPYTAERDKFYLIRNITDGNIVIDYRTYQGNRKKAIFTTKEKAKETIDKYLNSNYRIVEVEGLED